MRRLLAAACLAAPLALAGCGSAHVPTFGDGLSLRPPHAAAGSGQPAFLSIPSASAIPRPAYFAAQYLTLVGPEDAAAATFADALAAAGFLTTIDHLVAIGAPLAATLAAFDAQLLHVAWPASLLPAISDLVRGNAAYATALRDRSPSPASWAATADSASIAASDAADIVRSALGLQPSG